MSKVIPDEHLKSVCLGSGGACAFLMAGADGFECAKDSPGIKSVIDKRLEAGTMNAVGDHCSGLNSTERKEPN